MSLRRIRTRGILILALIVAAGLPLMTIHIAFAVGTVSVDTSNLSFPPVPMGTKMSVDVRVDNMDPFNSWDVAISTNTNALNGTSINIQSETVFPKSGPGSGQLLELENCVNGVGNCPQNSHPDGMGIIHSQVTFLSSVVPNPPITGVLFTINYVSGTLNFTNIHFQANRIINPNNSNPDVPNTPVDGLYGTPPSPDFTPPLVSPHSLTLTVGSSVHANLIVSSVNAFTGLVNFTSTVNSPGISAVFTPNNVTLNSSTATSKILVSASQTITPSQYILNITATSGGIVHFALVDLSVQSTPDFVVGAQPQTLKIAQATSGLTTILLTSGQASGGFNGDVKLSVVAPKNPWNNDPVNASLGQTTLHIEQGGTNSTTLSVSVPPSPYAYSGLESYLINVTATSAQNQNLSHTITVTVVPPSFDLVPDVTPSSLTISVGHSGFSTLTVTGVNYFVGTVYASSTLSGGTARYNVSSTFLGVGQTVSFGLNITIGASTIPGTYAVLLTAYSGTGIARSVIESINVRSNRLSSQLPTKILGLPIPVYFGVLGAFAIVLVLLTVVVYRKSRLDRDEWE